MARPALGFSTIAPQQTGWDAQVDDNFTEVKEKLTIQPFPLSLVYKTTPYSGALHLSDLDAADYLGCYMHLTDPASIAANGHMIYSDGVDWLYVRSGSAV
jgi:hypothetical protein